MEPIFSNVVFTHRWFRYSVLLASQLATLEPLGADEPGWAIDASEPVETVAEMILERLGLA